MREAAMVGSEEEEEDALFLYSTSECPQGCGNFRENRLSFAPRPGRWTRPLDFFPCVITWSLSPA